MTKLLLLSLAFILSSCNGSGGTSRLSAGGSGSISPTTPLRWPAGTLAGSLNIKTSQDFINDFAPADLDGDGDHPIDQGAKEWNTSHDSFTFIKVPSDTVPNLAYANVSSFKDSQMGIYKSYTWFSSINSNTLAITQFFGFRRNAGLPSEYIELRHADIIVNYRDFNFAADGFDLNTVIIHELGHLLGLRHNWGWDGLAVMAPSLKAFDSKRVATESDKASINNNYPVGAPLVANTNSGGFASFSPNAGEGEAVSGTFELRSDGKCHHFVNREEVLVH